MYISKCVSLWGTIFWKMSLPRARGDVSTANQGMSPRLPRKSRTTTAYASTSKLDHPASLQVSLRPIGHLNEHIQHAAGCLLNKYLLAYSHFTLLSSALLNRVVHWFSMFKSFAHISFHYIVVHIHVEATLRSLCI